MMEPDDWEMLVVAGRLVLAWLLCVAFGSVVVAGVWAIGTCLVGWAQS